MSATWDRQTADTVDPETRRRVKEHAKALVAGWPPLNDRQRDAVRNAFRRSPVEQKQDPAA